MNVDLRACIAGRKDAWDHFVRVTAPVIYAAVRRAIRHRAAGKMGEVDDRVQDVYVRLLREDCRLLRVFDPARASLPTWLTLIARTVVHEHLRKRGPLPAVSLNGAESAATAPAAAEAPAGDAAALSEMGLPLSLLSDQQRAVIDMLFQQGLSVEQAAARLGVEAQTIRSAKHKALTRLREHFARLSEEGDQNMQPESRGYSADPAPRTKESDADVAPIRTQPRAR